MRVFWAILTLAMISTLPASAGAVDEEGRPPLLKPQSGCERWLGRAEGGNDPSVRVQIRVCRRPEGVVGDFQWSSKISGWSHRRVAGEWGGEDGRTLSLYDVEIVEEHPNPGWRFCLVDTFTLHRDGEALDGEYWSKECDDHAQVHLRLQGEAEDIDAPPPIVPQLPAPRPTDSPPVRFDVCGLCAVTAAPAPAGGALVVAAGLLLLLGRRRR